MIVEVEVDGTVAVTVHVFGLEYPDEASARRAWEAACETLRDLSVWRTTTEARDRWRLYVVAEWDALGAPCWEPGVEVDVTPVEVSAFVSRRYQHGRPSKIRYGPRGADVYPDGTIVPRIGRG